jgi:hypothetical protein
MSELVSGQPNPKRLFKEGLGYYDVNLVDNPFCIFSKKDLERLNSESDHTSGRIIKASKGIIYRYTFTDPATKVARFWTIQPDAILGWPGPLDQDFLGFVKYYALNGGLIGNNMLELPSWRDICKMMGDRGVHPARVKECAQRIAGTVIKTDSFFVKDTAGNRNLAHRTERDPDYIFTLWSYFRRGESLPDGTSTERVVLWLNEPFLSSLKSFHVRPFDYAYFQELPALAKRIYLIQGRKFFGLKRSAYTKEEYKSWCLQLPLAPQDFLSKAKERLHNAHQALIETQFLEEVEWIGSQKRPPWEIRYYPGPRAREEVKQGKHRLRRLNAQETHQNAKDGRFNAHDWLAQLSQDLKDTSGKNSGFYFKLGKAISQGLIRDSLIWSSLSIAKDTMRTHRLKKEMSACFTDELKRSLQQSGKDLKEILSKV